MCGTIFLAVILANGKRRAELGTLINLLARSFSFFISIGNTNTFSPSRSNFMYTIILMSIRHFSPDLRAHVQRPALLSRSFVRSLVYLYSLIPDVQSTQVRWWPRCLNNRLVGRAWPPRGNFRRQTQLFRIDAPIKINLDQECFPPLPLGDEKIYAKWMINRRGSTSANDPSLASERLLY